MLYTHNLQLHERCYHFDNIKAICFCEAEEEEVAMVAVAVAAGGTREEATETFSIHIYIIFGMEVFKFFIIPCSLLLLLLIKLLFQFKKWGEEMLLNRRRLIFSPVLPFSLSSIFHFENDNNFSYKLVPYTLPSPSSSLIQY